MGTVTTTANPQVTITQINTKGSSIKVFNGDYHWVEYRKNITTNPAAKSPLPMGEKIERIERSDGDYKGIPAIHYKITTTLDYPEWVGDKLIHTANGWIICYRCLIMTHVDEHVSWWDHHQKQLKGRKKTCNRNTSRDIFQVEKRNLAERWVSHRLAR